MKWETPSATRTIGGYRSRRSPGRQMDVSPQIQFLEEIIALVVDDDEGREIHHLDAPDRFHAELGIFHHLDLLDAVLGALFVHSSDPPPPQAPMLLPRFPH